MGKRLFIEDDFPKDNEVYLFMVRSYNPLGRIIRFFLWIKQKVLRKQSRDLYNHADLCIMQNTVVGTTARGVLIRSIGATYGDGKRKEIKVFMVPMDDLMKFTLINWCLDQSGKRYEYVNIFQHLWRILYIILYGREKWIGHTQKHAQDRYYCSEFVSTAITIGLEGFSLTPWDDDPMDLLELAEKKLPYVKDIRL